MQYIEVMIPVILLVLTGVLLYRFKLMNDSAAAGLSAFLFNCAIPALIFVSIASVPLHEILDWEFIVGYLITVLVTFFVTFFIFKVLVGRDLGRATMAGFCSSASNTALIALPILLGLFGQKASIPVAITIVIFVLILMPILSFSMEYSQKGEERAGKMILKALKGTITNPFVVAGIFGAIFSFFEIPLPKPIDSFFHYLGNTTIACALVIIGIGLYGVKFSGRILEVISITVINIVLKPVLALFLAYVLGLSGFYAVSLLACSAVPTAKTAYIFAKHYRVYEQETAATILLGSVLTVFTLPFYLWVATHFWPNLALVMK